MAVQYRSEISHHKFTRKTCYQKNPLRQQCVSSANKHTARLSTMYEIAHDHRFPSVGVLLWIYKTILVPMVFFLLPATELKKLPRRSKWVKEVNCIDCPCITRFVLIIWNLYKKTFFHLKHFALTVRIRNTELLNFSR